MAGLTLIETNFAHLWDTTAIADTVPERAERWFPIPPIVCPYLVEHPVLAVASTAETAQENWKFGGRAKQIIRTGLTVGGTTDTVSSVKKFYLNQISLLWFPDYTAEYSLEFSIPYWLRDITIRIWQYTGPINHTYDQILSEIKGAVMP